MKQFTAYFPNGWVITVIAAMAIWLSGCEILPNAKAKTPLQGLGTAGVSREKRLIDYEIWGENGKTVLVLAGLHGDEPGGVAFCQELSRRLRRGEIRLHRVQLLLVKAVNPDGLAKGRRENSGGVDLNRNFPGANRVAMPPYGMEPFSEPETRAIHFLLTRFKPAHVIAFHGTSGCLAHNGLGRDLAQAITCCCTLPPRNHGPQPGTLAGYVEEHLRLPMVTVEFPAAAQKRNGAYLWYCYGSALLYGGIEYKNYP